MDREDRLAEGVALQKAGQIPEATAIYREILDEDPQHADALHFLGLAYYQMGQHAKAARHILAAIQVDGSKAQYFNNLGLVYRALGKSEEATQCFAQAIGKEQNNVVAHNNLAVVAQEQGRVEEAQGHLERAQQLRSAESNRLLEEGRKFLSERKLDAAVQRFERLVSLHPQSAAMHLNLGIALHNKRDFAAAEQSFRACLEIAPDNLEALNGLSAVLTRQGMAVEAEELLRRALESNPDHANVHSNLAVALMEQGKLDEAESECWRAIELEVEEGTARANLGMIYLRMGRVYEGMRTIENVLRTKPSLPDARWNRALALLALGRYEEGWLEYEWRWARGMPRARKIPKPLWDGRPIAGKTIFLHAEQGFGDTFQFLRFAKVLSQQGAEIILACQDRLIPLLKLQPYLQHVFPYQQQFPRFDVHAPLLSLPGILGTTVDTVPNDVPYLEPDPKLQAEWATKLGQIDGFKVGIVWQGNPRYASDPVRSIPLDCFREMSQLPGVQLISLQMQHGLDQLETLRDEINLLTFPDLDMQTGPFMDTAALVKSLDLVISCDTALTHLAGALGTRVWLATAFSADWRWMIERSDSPWYPTVQIYRQQSPGNWDSVFADMYRDMQLQVAKSASV